MALRRRPSEIRLVGTGPSGLDRGAGRGGGQPAHGPSRIRAAERDHRRSHAWRDASGCGGRGDRPCILWNDTRSEAEAARLDATDQVRELSGNIVFFRASRRPSWNGCGHAGALSPASGAFARRLSQPLPDRGLCVRHVRRCGTSWLDTGRREWSDYLLEQGHMRRDQMPRIVEGADRAGTLRADLARKWGVGGDVAVAGGAGDNAAAACGIRALDEGQGFVSLGTSGVIVAARQGYARAETAVTPSATRSRTAGTR
ncbi:MAG: FGGY family carbohydrate kinase [Defluviimonas denitrificans]